MTENEKAFLDMLAWSELKDLLTVPGSDNGYNIVVGSTVDRPIFFDDYSDHPRVRVTINKKKGLISSAAGRGQMKRSIYDELKKRKVMKDFSPAEQDKGYLYLIAEKHATAAINSGYIKTAIKMVAPIWASLSGAGYGQHENSIEELIEVYKKAGGTVT